jgi:type II secretory pathway pseudopilin PulG
MLNFRKQAGDTIIEVLLAIVVLSSVLAGAYVSSNRSLNTTTRNRERNEANKIAQSQVELLRAALQTPPTSDTQDPTQQGILFCLVSGSPIVLIPMPANTLPPLAASTDIDATNYDPACIHDINDDVFNAASSPGLPFYIAIIHDPSGADANFYIINVRWNSFGGGEEVRFLYRVYRGYRP